MNDSVPKSTRLACAAIVCLLWCASLPITLSQVSVGAASYSVYRDELGFVLRVWFVTGLVPLAVTLLARRSWMVVLGLLIAFVHMAFFGMMALSAGLVGYAGSR